MVDCSPDTNRDAEMPAWKINNGKPYAPFYQSWKD